MHTDDLPYAIDDIVLNVKADFIKRGLLDRNGTVPDLLRFKLALVSSLKKPIVVRPGEDLAAKLAEGHDLLTQIRVWVVMDEGRPVRAGFRRSHLRAEGQATLNEYVLRRTEKGDDVRFVGQPQLTSTEQDDLFTSLGRDLVSSEVFDNEPPAVSAALRDLLERR